MVPLEEVHKLLDQAISAWSNRQYEEISHGTTNGPPGRMLRIFLPIIDVLINILIITSPGGLRDAILHLLNC